jgi:F-type H+-transporting ATPase subunit epsilon
MAFRVAIITPESTAFDGEVERLTVPSLDGEITILSDHEPLITLLSSGEMTIVAQGKQHHMAIHGGLVEVSQSTVRILTDAAELEEDIDERRAALALEQAKKMREESTDRVVQADASAAIERAIARLQLAKRRKLRHQA